MEKTTSAGAATVLGESAHCMPSLISHSALDLVRLKPLTECPLLSSRLTISLPITPSPTKPRFAISSSLPTANSSVLLVFYRGIAGIFTHLAKMCAHGRPRSRRVPVFNRFQDPLVMILAALRAAIDFKDAHPLFAKHSDDRVDQRKNQGIGGGLRQSQMEIKIRF